MFKGLLVAFLALTAGVSPADAQSGPYITGVAVTGGGAVPMRKNINDLQSAGGPQWDLYIRSVRTMYNASPTDPFSFFQIAGIHGKPFVQWNSGGAQRTNGWPGYCPHGEKIFLTWHRPFLVLYEQTLVAHAKKLAQAYPAAHRAKYVEAARTLRAPYWDWATSGIPKSVIPSMVDVMVPNGSGLKKISMKNPLQTYEFPKTALSGSFGEWDDERRSKIFRCPAPDRYPQSANSLLGARPYKQWVYDALTHSTTFEQFASTGSSGTSLEQIHNAVHWDAACGGQFLDAEFSAFDPIFMMHHANVDRLWAYWQAINPTKDTFTDSYLGGSRFSTPSRTRITPDSPLNPFYAAKGRLHTSNSVRSIKSFGYSYEGLEYWRMSASQLSAEAKKVINRIYGTSRKRSELEGRAEKTTRFFAKVSLEVSEVDRPCSVNLFVAGRRIGGLVVMMQPEEGIVHGEFSVDDAADTQELLEGCAPDKVAEAIRSGLTAEIVKHNGEKIAINTVPSLNVTLVDVPFTPPPALDELPTYGKARTRPADVKRPKTNVNKALSLCPAKKPTFKGVS